MSKRVNNESGSGNSSFGLKWTRSLVILDVEHYDRYRAVLSQHQHWVDVLAFAWALRVKVIRVKAISWLQFSVCFVLQWIRIWSTSRFAYIQVSVNLPFAKHVSFKNMQQLSWRAAIWQRSTIESDKISTCVQCQSTCSWKNMLEQLEFLV